MNEDGSRSFRLATGWPGWQRGLGLLLALLWVAAAGGAGWALSLRQGTATLRQEAGHKLDLFASAVNGVVKRLEPVPATVQLNPQVLALLRAPQGSAENARHAEAVNHYLRRLNAHLGSLAVFVLDERGTVLASSRSGLIEQDDDSHLGHDVAFRPYFLEALSGRVGRHFAVGVGHGEPGYFVSHPIRDGARVVGVAAIKISLAPIEQTWAMLGAPALLADTNQVVVLSSQAEWCYTALTEPSTEQRVDWQVSRLYEGHRIERFPLDVRLSIDEDSQVLEGMLPSGGGMIVQPRAGSGGPFGMLVLGRVLDGTDWRLMLFADLRSVRNQAALTGLLTALAAGFVALLGLLFNQRRRIVQQKLMAQQMLQEANAELEHKVARRTRALTEANTRLRKEVAEREQAEHTLRAAHNELVHAAKMAVLGQLATGITHELTQPLGAIRTLSGNASEFLRRGNPKAAESNLTIIARLADQMGGIIQPLKGFARKSEPKPQATDVGLAVSNALFLYNQRIRKEQVQLINTTQPGEVIAWCDPNRLEQVIINLIGNALDAMKDHPDPVLMLSAGRDAEGADPTPLAPVWMAVQDSGAGFGAAEHARLFEPFFTTKEVGSGLGLGLAISRDIVRAFGGDIVAHSPATAGGTGACFTVRLPEAPAPGHEPVLPPAPVRRLATGPADLASAPRLPATPGTPPEPQAPAGPQPASTEAPLPQRPADPLFKQEDPLA